MIKEEHPYYSNRSFMIVMGRWLAAVAAGAGAGPPSAPPP
jgi:hypothetical protein